MSSVEVEILGDGVFAGSIANIVDYNVQEYGTPLSMTDLSGGVSSVEFSVLEDLSFDGSILLPGQLFELRDPHAGVQRGVIDGASSVDDYRLSVQANGRLYMLVCEREAAPYSGALSGALLQYFALCGISDGVQFDPDIAAIQVSLPHWVGDVWTQVKKLMAIHQFEISEVGGVITVRKLRLRNIDVRRYTSTRLRYSRAEASQIVEVYYYNNESAVDRQIFPEPDSSILDRPIISVEAGETTVETYPVNMWIQSVEQPQHVLSLPWNNIATDSAFSVVDSKGVPVTIQEWRNGGGLVSFDVGEDGRSVDVTVRGMTTQSRAPYRIASSSADREYQYAALYIVASGVAFNRKLAWSATGEDLLSAPANQVTTIDDPMVSTRQDAVTVLSHAVRSESGFRQELEVSATAVNRRGETGQKLYPTFAQFDAEWADATFAQFDLAEAGSTFGAFMEAEGDKLSGDFETQALGGIGGARVLHRENMYRITAGSTSPSGFTWIAVPDLLFQEWDTLSPDEFAPFGEFDNKWVGKTFEQFARIPLH